MKVFFHNNYSAINSMALFDHVDTVDLSKPIMNTIQISGILDLTKSDTKKTKDHEIVIVNSQSKLIFVSDCLYVCELGGCLIYIRSDLLDVALISQTHQRICISFNRPWYVLDYKYIIEVTDHGLEYDKISTGRYFTHSEKTDRHTLFYTLLIILFVIFVVVAFRV